MGSFPPLITERLILRRLGDADAGDFYAYRRLAGVCRYQTFKPMRIQDAHAFIAALAPDPGVPGTWFQLAVCLKESGALIGDIGMHFMDGVAAEIGFTLDPRFQKKGYGSEAAEAAILYLFEEYGAKRVFAVVDRANEASMRLVGKLGMKKCARDLFPADTDESEGVYMLSADAFSARRGM
jgi:RimJ/RimL family protein N-acetyltransferase